MLTKVCTVCHQDKDLSQFYCYKGHYRGECKKCKGKKNVAQSKRRATQKSELDKEQTRIYARAYYARNKQKFEEYRKTFSERHPDYHKMYARAKKERQPNDRRSTRQSIAEHINI